MEVHIFCKIQNSRQTKNCNLCWHFLDIPLLSRQVCELITILFSCYIVIYWAWSLLSCQTCCSNILSESLFRSWVKGKILSIAPETTMAAADNFMWPYLCFVTDRKCPSGPAELWGKGIICPLQILAHLEANHIKRPWNTYCPPDFLDFRQPCAAPWSLPLCSALIAQSLQGCSSKVYALAFMSPKDIKTKNRTSVCQVSFSQSF